MKYEEVTLADITTELSDGLHKAPIFDANGEYLFVNAKNLVDGYIVDVDPEKHTTYEEYCKYKSPVCDRTILYSIDGTIGNLARYRGEKCVLGKGACYINVKNDVDLDYIYYVLQSDHFKSYIQLMSTGSTIKHISLKTMRNYRFLLPELSVQKKISGLLKAIDDKIETNRRINDNLEQQGMTLFRYFFPYSSEDDLPLGWTVETVGDVIEIHDSRRIPLSGAQRAKMTKRQYPYYGAASLMDYVDEYIFDGKYLLFGEDGTVVDDAGYPILQYVWGKFWVNNHAHILTGKMGFSVESLLLLFKQTSVSSIITGAVQPKISQANLKSIPVVVPPLSELEAFDKLIQPLFDQIRVNYEQNKTLSSLRDALLPRLMSGEIDVSNVAI